MSTSNSESTTSPLPESSVQESKPKRRGETIRTHAISWTWLIGGLLSVLLLGGTAGLAYYFQTRSMASRLLDVADKMVKKSDEYKAEMEKTDEPADRRELALRSLSERREAAELLDNYRRANPGEVSETVLRNLYNILESLYEDYGGNRTFLGRQCGDQLIQLATELVPAVSDGESITYRTRLLQLESERVNFAGVISRGRELYDAAMRGGDPNNYDAQRYIAMSLFDHLPSVPYDPRTYSLPPVFPETMDELLGKLNLVRPEDIEIAKRYAEFIVSVDHENPERQRIIRACASDQLITNKTPETRLEEAKRIIDNMIQLNRDNPDAYLARYHFNRFFSPSINTLDVGDPDLATILRLAPSHAEGLILSGMDALRQMEIAARNNEPERAATWQGKAEEFLRRTVKDNLADPIGYLYLGDYLLFVKRAPVEAIEVFDDGLKNSEHRGSEELIGRLILVLLDQNRVDEVREKLGFLSRSINEMLVTRPEDVKRVRDMQTLLTAQLANKEANIAASKIAEARRTNNVSEIRRLANIEQSKRGEAMQRFEEVLRNWGTNQEDYLFLRERKSVYNMLLPEALLQLGDLKMGYGEWDRAAAYFERAVRIESPAVQRMALLRLSEARRQAGQLDRAAAALKAVADGSPNDLALRYAYTTLLFRSQITSNSPDPTVLDTIEEELEYLGQHRDRLAQPWALDVRLVHLGVLRANFTNSSDTIVEAMKEATRKFRALERKTFPPDADGNERQYIEDPAFVAEMVGIYSSMAERADFDRLLDVLRTFPGGEEAYYEARINDALRRGGREEAIVIVHEATTSTQLTDARRERFVALLQNLRGEAAESGTTLSRLYDQLKTTFDESPEMLNPQSFFLLANMSLDIDNTDQARKIMERLRQIEGPDGTTWRYIQVRLMLAEKDPDYVQMRRIQEEIAGVRPTWDMSYILRALIEEKFLQTVPGDPETLEKLIESYRNATAQGNANIEIWQRFTDLLAAMGRVDEARDAFRQAALRGVVLDSRVGQFPQPYARMYSQVQEAIAKEEPTEADRIAQQCIQLATVRGERPELLFALNLTLGKVFLDAEMYESAIRHLTETARSGANYVYPLAVCVARSGDIDGGFTLLLDEIDLAPSAMPILLPAILVLLSQTRPSEAVFERIDRLMERIERGERLTIRGTLPEAAVRDHIVQLGTRRVPVRRVQSFVIRLPEQIENAEKIAPSAVLLLSPEELEELLDLLAEEEDEEEEPAEQL